MGYLSHEDLSFNYAALCLAVLGNVPPEMAFELIEEGRIIKKDGRRKRNRFITRADIEDMIKLKEEGETWKSIGQMYGLSDSGAWRKVDEYKRRLAANA